MTSGPSTKALILRVEMLYVRSYRLSTSLEWRPRRWEYMEWGGCILFEATSITEQFNIA